MKLNLLSLLLAILSSSFMSAYPMSHQNLADSYTVSFITMQQGLPHNFVEEIYRDSKGYMWIATSASLARYDGYEFVSFTPNSLSRHIKSSFVRKVAEDRFGRLWAASDGGIDIINLTDLRPVNLQDHSGLFEKISYIPTSSICLDNDGNIWLRNVSDIICISFNHNGDISNILSLRHKTKHSQANACVKAVPEMFQKGVLSAMDGTICQLTVNGDSIVSQRLTPGLRWESMIFISDFATTDSRLWIATEQGLCSYDIKSRLVKLYDATGDKDSRLSQNFVNSLAVSPDGKLIAGCLNGINIIDPSTDKITRFDASEITGSPHNLNNNFINCLLMEDSNLWVGTEGSGINLFTPRRLYSEMLRHNPSDPSSLSPNCVNAIYEDGDGTVWVGTVEGGLNRSLNGYEGGFAHFSTATGSLTHNSVSAITSDHNGHLWVGTWGGGTLYA